MVQRICNKFIEKSWFEPIFTDLFIFHFINVVHICLLFSAYFIFPSWYFYWKYLRLLTSIWLATFTIYFVVILNCYMSNPFNQCNKLWYLKSSKHFLQKCGEHNFSWLYLCFSYHTQNGDAFPILFSIFCRSMLALVNKPFRKVKNQLFYSHPQKKITTKSNEKCMYELDHPFRHFLLFFFAMFG